MTTSPATLDAIVAAFAAGATSIDKVAALPGMPSGVTIRNLYKRDPAFRARLQPYWQPAAHTPDKYTQADYLKAAAALLTGIRAPALAKHGFASGPTLRQAAKRDPVVAEALRGVSDAKRQAKLDKYGAAVKKLEDGGLGKDLPALGLPSLALVQKFGRKLDGLAPRLDALKLRNRPKYGEEHFTRALKEIEGGGAAWRLSASGMVSKSTLLLYRRNNPAFDQRVRTAMRIRGMGGNAGGEDFQLRAQLSQNDIWSAVNSAVSRSLPSFIRDDVVSEMVADIIEGMLDIGDAKAAAREYVSDHYRAAGSYRERSMDAQLFSDGGRTLHDVLGG